MAKNILHDVKDSSKQDKRAISRKASNSAKSVSKIRSELKLGILKTTAWRNFKKNLFTTHEE